MESENSENEKFRVKIGKIASWKIRVWRGQNLDREKVETESLENEKLKKGRLVNERLESKRVENLKADQGCRVQREITERVGPWTLPSALDQVKKCHISAAARRHEVVLKFEAVGIGQGGPTNTVAKQVRSGSIVKHQLSSWSKKNGPLHIRNGPTY